MKALIWDTRGQGNSCHVCAVTGSIFSLRKIIPEFIIDIGLIHVQYLRARDIVEYAPQRVSNSSIEIYTIRAE